MLAVVCHKRFKRAPEFSGTHQARFELLEAEAVISLKTVAEKDQILVGLLFRFGEDVKVVTVPTKRHTAVLQQVIDIVQHQLR